MFWLSQAFLGPTSHLTCAPILNPVSQVKEAMQRIHDRGNIGKLILDVEKTPTPLVSQKAEESGQFNTRGSHWVKAQVGQREMQAARGVAEEARGKQTVV